VFDDQDRMNIQVFILVVGVVLALAGVVLPTANAQVQITQSSSMIDSDGQSISLKHKRNRILVHKKRSVCQVEERLTLYSNLES